LAVFVRDALFILRNIAEDLLETEHLLFQGLDVKFFALTMCSDVLC
jgi:hypothetical protein